MLLAALMGACASYSGSPEWEHPISPQDYDFRINFPWQGTPWQKIEPVSLASSPFKCFCGRQPVLMVFMYDSYICFCSEHFPDSFEELCELPLIIETSKGIDE